MPRYVLLREPTTEALSEDSNAYGPDGLKPFAASEIAWQIADIDPADLAPLGDGVPGARLEILIDDEFECAVVAIPVA